MPRLLEADGTLRFRWLMLSAIVCGCLLTVYLEHRQFNFGRPAGQGTSLRDYQPRKASGHSERERLTRIWR